MVIGAFVVQTKILLHNLRCHGDEAQRLKHSPRFAKKDGSTGKPHLERLSSFTMTPEPRKIP
jgi:hypothetical protein